jgi:hypothetical protein
MSERPGNAITKIVGITVIVNFMLVSFALGTHTTRILTPQQTNHNRNSVGR